MSWFKIVLLVYLCLVIIVALYHSGKGDHLIKVTTRGQAISAVLHTLLLVGVLIWL